MAGAQAAARLEDSYRVTFDEIAEVRRALSQRDPARVGGSPSSGSGSGNTGGGAMSGGVAPVASSTSFAAGGATSDLDRARIEQFKELLAERRASALAAFAGGSDVDQLRSLLAGSSGAPAGSLSSGSGAVGLGAGAGTGAGTGAGASRVAGAAAGLAGRAAPMAPVSVAGSAGGDAGGASGDGDDFDITEDDYPGADAGLDGNSGSEGRPRSTSPSRSGRPVYERLFNSGLSTKLKLDLQRREAVEPVSATPRINPVSARLRRDASVEDILLKRSAEYLAHKEELRREQEMRELAQLRKPAINKTSLRMRRDPVPQRMEEYQKAVQARRERLRTQIIAREREDVTGRPRINPASQAIQRSVDQFLIWQQERDRKLQRIKEQRERAELEAATGRPTLSRGSERIIRQQGRSGRVEELLLADAERARQKLEMAQRRREQEEAGPAKPAISAHSANLQREGDVADRLYALAQRRREMAGSSGGGGGEGAPAERSFSSAGSVVPRSRSAPRLDRDPTTGQRLFSPAINPRSAAIVRARPIEEVLHEKGHELAQRRERLATRTAEELRQEASKPKVGQYSALLVQLLESRTQTRTPERLHEPIHKLRPQTAHEIVEERRQQYSFKPAVNPISEQIDRTVNGPTDPITRLSLLLRKQEQYEQRKSRLQAEHVSQELRECTFLPQTPRSTSAGRSPSAPRPASATEIARRNAEWVRQREERLEHERRLRAEQELDECTFRPSVSPRPKSASSTPRARTDSLRHGSPQARARTDNLLDSVDSPLGSRPQPTSVRAAAARD